MLTIYIQTLTTEKIGIIEENDKIKELVIDRPTLANQVGNIYLARVKKIERGLQAAFVDIGQERPAFLPRNELPTARKESQIPIESIITEGQQLLVQIQKDAYGEKGARLTANVTIPGITVVYLPYGNDVAVSRKLEESQRIELKEKFQMMLEKDEGAIIRTSSQNFSADSIYSEFLSLREKWKEIKQVSKAGAVPSCVYNDQVVPDQLIRKYSPNLIKSVYIDNASEANQLRNAYTYLKDLVHWDKDLENRLPVSIKQLMLDVVNPSVQINGGIELSIEQTEALTVIDIDTGGYTGKWSKSQTIVHANKQAAVEVAQQIRLRNISGIVIIDFIDMKEDAHKKQVIKTLKSELAKDPVRTEVFGFTRLGLLEMTRKRESYTLPYLLLSHQQSKDSFSTTTYACMLERELLSYQNSQVEAIYIEINPKVLERFNAFVRIEQLKVSVKQEIFVKQTKGVASYQVKRAGSELLIQELIANNKGSAIDKLF